MDTEKIEDLSRECNQLKNILDKITNQKFDLRFILITTEVVILDNKYIHAELFNNIISSIKNDVQYIEDEIKKCVLHIQDRENEN